MNSADNVLKKKKISVINKFFLSINYLGKKVE